MFVAHLGVWFWFHERIENFIVLDHISILSFHRVVSDRPYVHPYSGLRLSSLQDVAVSYLPLEDVLQRCAAVGVVSAMLT